MSKELVFRLPGLVLGLKNLYLRFYFLIRTAAIYIAVWIAVHVYRCKGILALEATKGGNICSSILVHLVQ